MHVRRRDGYVVANALRQFAVKLNARNKWLDGDKISQHAMASTPVAHLRMAWRPAGSKICGLCSSLRPTHELLSQCRPLRPVENSISQGAHGILRQTGHGACGELTMQIADKGRI